MYQSIPSITIPPWAMPEQILKNCQVLAAAAPGRFITSDPDLKQ